MAHMTECFAILNISSSLRCLTFNHGTSNAEIWRKLFCTFIRTISLNVQCVQFNLQLRFLPISNGGNCLAIHYRDNLATLLFIMFLRKRRGDHGTWNPNLSNSELAQKKIVGTSFGFGPMASTFVLQCPTSWTMKTHTWRKGQIIRFILTRERNQRNNFLVLTLILHKWYQSSNYCSYLKHYTTSQKLKSHILRPHCFTKINIL